MRADTLSAAQVELPDLDEFRRLRGAERDRAFMAVERELRRLRALQAEMIHEVAVSCSYLDDCHHSAHAWLQGVSNSSPTTAQRWAQAAEMLADLPALAAAASAGFVGADQLELLRQLYVNDRCREHLPGAQPLFVDAAQQLTLRDFRQVWQRWKEHADTDGTHRDHELSRRHRHVSSAEVGAGHVLTAEGDALSGSIIDEILDAHAEAEYQTDLAARLAEHGELARAFPLARTSAQRRYDALVQIFLKAAGTVQVTAQLPLVNIVCDEVTAHDAVRSFFGCASPSGGAESGRLRLCETAGGAPVDRRDLVVALLIGSIRRVMRDGTGRIVDLGRRARLFTGAAREAILLLGDRCSHPGCERRLGIQVDHLQPWARAGGTTNPLNGGPACAAHNVDKHTNRISVLRDEAGWHHFRPDGSEICPRHPPNSSRRELETGRSHRLPSVAGI